jgi:hypothetical protein
MGMGEVQQFAVPRWQFKLGWRLKWVVANEVFPVPFMAPATLPKTTVSKSQCMTDRSLY